MEVCLAELHGRPVILEMRDGIVYIDNDPQPIKHLTEERLRAFKEELDGIPGDDAGSRALASSRRAAFIVELLGSAVGDECVDMLSHILDHVHYDVLEYLGENVEAQDQPDPAACDPAARS